MPNLVPPVVTRRDALSYQHRIKSALSKSGITTNFEPLMTLYLTEATDADDVAMAYEEGLAKAVKLYPAGATTNSDSGVRDINKVMPVLERMAEIGMPLCVHGEVTDPDVDIFDREACFIERVLMPLREKIPTLKIVMEHITTRNGVKYVESDDPATLAATITTHHLIINRNHILVGGIKPHYYCLPVAKRESHRLALLKAATSGNPRFFLGTDSAPHADDAKENACGCAGIFTASNTMPILAQVFEEAGALDKLEDYTSRFGAEFYGLPLNNGTITLVKHDKPVVFPNKIPVEGGGFVTVFDPGFPIYWEVTA